MRWAPELWGRGPEVPVASGGPGGDAWLGSVAVSQGSWPTPLLSQPGQVCLWLPGAPWGLSQETWHPCSWAAALEDMARPWLVVTMGAPTCRVSSPYYSSGLSIIKSEAYTKVYSRAGLLLLWNREDALMVGTVGGAVRALPPVTESAQSWEGTLGL